MDAICLNQADNYKKAAQVQLMGEVYIQAKKVQIWANRMTISQKRLPSSDRWQLLS
jgi:hypothetical protein